MTKIRHYVTHINKESEDQQALLVFIRENTVYIIDVMLFQPGKLLMQRNDLADDDQSRWFDILAGNDVESLARCGIGRVVRQDEFIVVTRVVIGRAEQVTFFKARIGQRKHFVNLPKELDPDEAELTRTRKLRRGLLEERYGDLIRAIYNGNETFETKVAVKYRDGRTGVVKTQTRINAVV